MIISSIADKQRERNAEYLYSALVRMGNASMHMSLANNCVENISEVTAETKAKMKSINSSIHQLQVTIRQVRKEMIT
jgi:hypothetical protein